MLFLSIVHHYLLWHYSRAFLEIFHVWLNFLWFVVHFFSIPQLLRSLFSPWKRIVEGRGNKWSFEDLAAYVIIGFFSRLIGFFIRFTIILIGLLSLLFVVVAGFAVYFFWIAAPLIIIALFVFGFTLLLA
jgi:hypothetical protein